MNTDSALPANSLINFIKESVWQQFGASLDMLENAIDLWPGNDWDTEPRFFYLAYHTIVFLDYYSTMPAAWMSSPLPFTFKKPADVPEEAIDDIVPDKIYSKQELLDYLDLCRKKCYKLISSFNEKNFTDRWIEQGDDRNYAIFELILYNMRHVQHHTAQLNLLLRKKIGSAPDWVSRAKSDNGL